MIVFINCFETNKETGSYSDGFSKITVSKQVKFYLYKQIQFKKTIDYKFCPLEVFQEQIVGLIETYSTCSCAEC